MSIGLCLGICSQDVQTCTVGDIILTQDDLEYVCWFTNCVGEHHQIDIFDINNDEHTYV